MPRPSTVEQMPALCEEIRALGAVIRHRSLERRALLWTLAVAAEKNISLGQAARSFASDRIDDMGRRCHKLADDFESINDGLAEPDAFLKQSDFIRNLGWNVPVSVTESANPMAKRIDLMLSKTGKFNRVQLLAWRFPTDVRTEHGKE